MGIYLDAEITGRLKRMLDALTDPDFSTLMTQIEYAIQEGHIRGVMAGTDGKGRPMTPTSYRMSKNAPLRRNRTIRNARFGAPGITENDNLTTAEYVKLKGPPLAPRGLNSRVIRNFATESGLDSDGWYVTAYLVGIISRKGIPFMQYHFNGEGHLPKRDLRGIRPDTMAKIRRLLQLEIRRQFFAES